MSRISIKVDSAEAEALVAISRQLRRDPRDQAALFVRERLIQLGALPPPPTPPQPTEAQR